MGRRGGSNGAPWGQMILAFLSPLIGLALCQAANNRESENAPYLRIATLVGFALYLVLFGLYFLL